MYCIRRSCSSSILTSRNPSIVALNGTRKAFSSSPISHRGSLPEFLPPSSETLSSLLYTLNTSILLPRHLNREQQALVYKKENAPRLEAEPVDITLGNVTVPLVHIDRAHGLPSHRQSIRNIVKESKTADDWENVLRMLQGLTDAGVKIGNDRLEFIARKLGEAGMHSLLVKAVVRGKETGMRLKSEDLAWVVLRQFIRRAEESGWEGEETEKMVGMVETVLEALEGKEHLGNKKLDVGDSRANPLLMGVVAQLTARSAKAAGEGDSDGKVAKYARRAVAGLREEGNQVEAVFQELEQVSGTWSTGKLWLQYHSVHRVEELILRLLPLWDALKVSRQVLGAELPDAIVAQEWEAKLEKSSLQGAELLETIRKAGLNPPSLETVIAKVKAIREG